MDLCPGRSRSRKLALIKAYLADPMHDRRTGRILVRRRDELVCEAVLGYGLNSGEGVAMEGVLRRAPRVGVGTAAYLSHASRERPGIPIAHWLVASYSFIVGVVLMPVVVVPLIAHIRSWRQLGMCVLASCAIEVVSPFVPRAYEGFSRSEKMLDGDQCPSLGRVGGIRLLLLRSLSFGHESRKRRFFWTRVAGRADWILGASKI